MSKTPEQFVYIVSLGCPKNFVDTEVMAAALLQNNVGITPYLEDADIMLVNTCAFIPEARSEAVENVENAIAWKNEAPKSRSIIISGCLNQWDIDQKYSAAYPEVDLWLGIDQVEKIPGYIFDLLDGQVKENVVVNKKSEYLYDDTTPRLQLTLPHYAYVKIADGCDHNCSYCSIPRIRGKLRSRTMESVVKESKNLIESGVKELILIAQDTTFFGDDNDDPNVSLAGLVKEIDKIPGDYWIRIMYTHPASFPQELIDVFKNSKHLVPYLDIPLQHISDRILDSMGRKITTARIKELLSDIRKEIPEMCFRTTFIIGYPGETDEEYQEVYNLCDEFEFDRMGAFVYSPEPYTRAATMENQVSKDVAQTRCDELMALQQEISLERNEALVGKTFDVIIDMITEDGTGIGRSYMDAPEIDNAIIVRNDGSLEAGDRVVVKITDCSEYDLEGVAVQ